MPTTRGSLRRLLAEALGGGPFTSLSTSGAGAANGTTLVDADLTPFGDDFFNDWWVVLPSGPSGSGAYEMRRATDFASATGTLTVSPAFSAQVASGVPYELHAFSPDRMHLALNRAIEACFPFLYRGRLDESLVVDNLLANADFEDALTGTWSATGVSTVGDSARKWHGKLSIKLIAGAGGGTLSQSLTVNIREITGKSVVFACWVFATTANSARLKLDFGPQVKASDYHSGKDQWERLELTALVPDDATQLVAALEVAANQTAWFDASSLHIDPVYRYPIPSSILLGPYQVLLQEDIYHPDGPYHPIGEWHYEEDANGRYLVLGRALPSGRRLRLTGLDMLSRLNAEADTTEVDPPRTQVLVARAAWFLLEMEANNPALSPERRGELLGLARSWEARWKELLGMPGYRQMALPVTRHERWLWG